MVYQFLSDYLVKCLKHNLRWMFEAFLNPVLLYPFATASGTATCAVLSLNDSRNAFAGKQFFLVGTKILPKLLVKCLSLFCDTEILLANHRGARM